MGKHTIFLFMWGYQTHYRAMLEYRAKEVFKLLGVVVEPKVLLVGALDPQKKNLNPVCVEPEDGEWPLELFSGLPELIESNVKNHSLNNMFYGDEESMRRKPEVIRRGSVTSAVREKLTGYDVQHGVRSFCGSSYPVGDYYVVPVIQVPEFVFRKFPPLEEIETDDRWARRGYRSFIHACMGKLLEEATQDLQHPDPGSTVTSDMRQPSEIVRIAATSFMFTPAPVIAGGYDISGLFERFNLISSLMYEGVKGTGQLLLVNPNSNAIEYSLRLKTPVPFREPRWARKILQMATKEIALIADAQNIYGLGRLKADHDLSAQDVFTIEFLDHYHWELRFVNQVLLRSRYGEPTLPQEPVSRERFIDNYSRLFPDASEDDHNLLWELFNAAMQQGHGCMFVVAMDAAEEAQRLSQQGSCIEPVPMTAELFSRVSGIDGTVILDQHGVCHAVGVILDGPATSDCTPSRGSRFNSGVRYVDAGQTTRLAIVVSDDHTVDLFPLLRHRIKREDVELNISALEKATLDNYHKPRNWLDEHRFYLSDEQCQKVNLALDRIEALPKDVGRIVIITTRFKVNQLMDDGYFVP